MGVNDGYGLFLLETFSSLDADDQAQVLADFYDDSELVSKLAEALKEESTWILHDEDGEMLSPNFEAIGILTLELLEERGVINNA